MATQLWIGFGFLTLLVIFFIVICLVAILGKRTIPPELGPILRVLMGLCAGFSGWFIAGGITVDYHWTSQTGTLGVSAVSGFGLAVVVFVLSKYTPGLKGGVSFTIVDGWTFQETVETVLKAAKGLADYDGFKSSELSAPMKGQEISASSMSEGIGLLRLATSKTNAIRSYDVVRKDSVFHLKIKK
jgi:hypothetical protein